MKKKLSRISLMILIAAMSAVVAFGQETFSDPNVEYEFNLPSSDWQMVKKPSSYSPNVEYVYNNRDEALLQIRSISVDKDESFKDILREEELKLQFLQGYVAGKTEDFTGNYPGRVFNFEYVKSGRPMSGRFYFLRTSPTTVYVLRFTGRKDSLRLIRNETDSIARTFRLK